jgi:hypothetical protein
MRIQRAFLAVVVSSVLASALGAASAWADGSPPSQLNNVATQVADLQSHINQMLAKGQVAQTGSLTASSTCNYQAPSQVFLPWADLGGYSLAPQGGFSEVSGWQLDKTTFATDHDPWTAGTTSLRIPGNGQATTPAMCVNLSNPTIRLFIKNAAGLNTDLKVDVLYENLQGNVTTLNLAKLRTSSSGWQPSIPIPIGVNLASVGTASGYAAVAFVFKPEGLAAGQYWAIDSLYVDPFCSR